MAFADWLTQGAPGQNATSFSQGGTTLPSYLEDYTHGILSSAAQLGSQPYQPYPNARIAPRNEWQNRAETALSDTVGKWGYQWRDAYDTTNRAAGISGLEPASALMNQSTQIDPRAGVTGDLATARQSFPGAFQDYMNPFTQNVTDEIGRLGQRNWQENILPSLNDQFTRSGQYGSLQNQRQAERTGRDVSADITGQQSMAMERGYNQAGALFNQDANRALSTASTSAGIDENYARRLAESGVQLGGLYDRDRAGALSAGAQQLDVAKAGQEGHFRDISAMENIGALKQANQQGNLDLAYDDFRRQEAFPREQIGFLTNTARGVPYSSTQYSSTSQPSGYNPSVLAQLAGGAAGLAGLSKLFAHGGRVRRFAAGGEVDQDRQPGPRLSVAGYLRALTDAGYLEPQPTAGYLQLARTA